MPLRKEMHAGSLAIHAALATGVGITVFIGWREFWFLTDDAFIAFRYVSNRMLGWGLVWNPPPFAPVEGYSSFLWVVLLEGVWRMTGVEPPAAANVMGLLFGYASLGLVAHLVMRMQLPKRMASVRTALLVGVLLATVSNRTFLTWLSSGLETPLFNFCVLAWVTVGVVPADRRGTGWILALSASATCTALTRPDGLLICAATVVLIAVHLTLAERGLGLRGPRSWVGAAPLLLIALHVLWRRLTYGAWLPNTYYAKYTGAWPESGLRYLACFVLEYGVWMWMLLCAMWAIRATIRRSCSLAPVIRKHYAVICVIATLSLHLVYYTFVIGGDHFEYRVYSHLVPLLFVSGAWLAARAVRAPAVALTLFATFVVVSWPLQWVHWRETHHIRDLRQVMQFYRPIAPHFPVVLRPLVHRWDGWQLWLVRHHVGLRHMQHRAFYENQVAQLPSREEGSRIRWQQRAVHAHTAVGVRGWVLPEVAIIDLFGLNDRVIARSPIQAFAERHMAHDRSPPPGYVGCFRPNLDILNGTIQLRHRAQPLTDERIRACESRDWFSDLPGGTRTSGGP